MYITRVEIDLEDRRKIRGLTHLGAYHNWVELSFPKEIKEGVRSRKLWRVDQLGGRRYLLILSETRPDLEAVETYGKEGSAQCKDYDAYLKKMKTGDRMRFRLVANPVYADYQEARKRGIERPHVTAAHQMEYFMERTEKHGFRAAEEDVRIVERGFEILRKSNAKPVRVVKAAYEGILTITDIELFRDTLIQGIGKKKAYGFGLLTVIPENVNHG